MSQYQVIQLHDPVDSTTLQFPRVPWEAICESPDKLTTQIGFPATVTSLSNITSNTPAPTSVNELYYNEATRKIYKAVSSGGSVQWDSGSQPEPGVLYRGRQAGETSDTLYVKSIDSQGILLAKLEGNSGGNAYVPGNQGVTTSAASAGSASSAGIASSLTAAARTAIISSAVASVNITSVASANKANSATSATSATNAGYAVSAGIASAVTDDVKTAIIQSAAGQQASTDWAASAGSATSAGVAAGLTSAAKAALLGSVSYPTSVSSADYASGLFFSGSTDTTGGAVSSIPDGGKDSYIPTIKAVRTYVASHAGTGTGGDVTWADSAGSAASAGVASSLTSAAKAAIINSAAAAVDLDYVETAGSASSAGTAAGLTTTAMNTVVSSVLGSISITSVASAGSASSAGYASSAGGLTSTAASAIVSSAVASVNITSVAEAGVASSLTAAAKADIIASAGSGGSVSVSATYGGPFAVTTSGTSIKVDGGRMYLGGAEYAVGSTTLTSGNGNIYYYLYYSSGSYYSGCSLASSATALAAVIRGSQGYYTALANVQGGNVTQCHYGDIRIDGRVS